MTNNRQISDCIGNLNANIDPDHLLLINNMTENVFGLTHNYRVKSEWFKKILVSLRKGEPTHKNA